jgi:hypothetical protein
VEEELPAQRLSAGGKYGAFKANATQKAQTCRHRIVYDILICVMYMCQHNPRTVNKAMLGLLDRQYGDCMTRNLGRLGLNWATLGAVALFVEHMISSVPGCY